MNIASVIQHRDNCHCAKTVQILSFFWSAFSFIWTENGKIWARKNSVFELFSRSVSKYNSRNTIPVLRILVNSHESLKKKPPPDGIKKVKISQNLQEETRDRVFTV